MAKDTTRTEAAELDLEENARQIKEAREKLEKDAAEKKAKYAAFMQELPEEEQAKNSPVFNREDLFKKFHDNPLEKSAIEQELDARCLGAIAQKAWITDPFLWIQLSSDEKSRRYVVNGLNSTAFLFNELLKIYKALYQYDPKRVKHYEAQIKAVKEVADLFPFLFDELQKPIYCGKSPSDLFKEAKKDENGQPVKNSLYVKAYTAALKALKGENTPQEEIEKYTAAPVTSFFTPLDKVNNAVWTKPTEGSFVTEFAIATKGKGKDKKELKVTYSADFRALDNATSRKLNAFDKRVVFAVAACMDAGNEIISYSQLYRAMGGKSSISASQISAIDRSLNLLAATRVIYTLAEEKGFSYKGINIDAACIEFERIKKVDINGAIADGAIRPLRYPPAVTFAKEINQITTNDIKLLQDIPLNLTQETCAITDYILAHIAMMNNKGGDISSFLLETICKETGVSNPRQKLRAIDKITKVLESCKKYKKIKSFSYDKDKKKFSITY